MFYREGIYSVLHVKPSLGVENVAAVRDVENLYIQRVDKAERYEFIDALAVESAATIVVNGKEIATMACSPLNLRYLAAGFLASEGMIGGREEIKRITVDEGQIPVRIKIIADIRFLRQNAPAVQ